MFQIPNPKTHLTALKSYYTASILLWETLWSQDQARCSKNSTVAIFNLYDVEYLCRARKYDVHYNNSHYQNDMILFTPTPFDLLPPFL